MLPIPCYFPRNGRRAPCGRSNCFPVMWKTNQEKEGRECERKIATHPLAGPGDAWNDPSRAWLAGVRARVQSPGNVFFILFCIFLVFCHGTKQLREGSSAPAVRHRSRGSAGPSFGKMGRMSSGYLGAWILAEILPIPHLGHRVIKKQLWNLRQWICSTSVLQWLLILMYFTKIHWWKGCKIYP